MNRSPRFTFLSLAGFYLAVVGAQAATRLLWGDELITLAIAHTGSVAGIWSALTLGADPNPPLSHVAVLFATRLLGEGALAVRVPSIAAMLLAVACVWGILRRWVAPGFAAAGVLALMATRGFDYSYEARSYAPLAGFSLAALFCWLRASDQVDATEAERAGAAGWTPQGLARAGWLAGMTACLALAVSANYYGVLAWFPIGAGELLFSLRRRRVYPATWLCLLLAALPLYGYRVLIRQNIAEFAPHAWNKPQLSFLSDSYLVLVEGVFWPVAAGAALLWWTRGSDFSAAGARGCDRRMKTHERVALGVLLGYPVLGLALAWAEAGMISPRCVIPVCCGFAIAAGVLAARLVRGPGVALIVLGTGVLWVCARESACAFLLQQQRATLLALVRRVESAPAGPVYISDSSLALPLAHYGSAGLRQRMVFPIDFTAIHTWEAEDSGEQNLWAGRNGVFPFRIVPYSAELALDRPALVLARPGGWLTRRLAQDGLLLKDVIGPLDTRLLGNLGGVFTPMAHGETRILAPGD